VLLAAGNAPDGETYSQKVISGLRHTITELGLKRILLASNYDGVFLGDGAYDSFSASAEELRVPVIIHPAVEPVEAPFSDAEVGILFIYARHDKVEECGPLVI
jgi:predicted TIM-barrel fold metal-dependent hydrolase